MGANFFDSNYHPIFNLNRKQRKNQLVQITLESLKSRAEGPMTKPELQKLVKIRKKTFLPILKYLVEIGYVVKTGQGSKGSPFKYHLADHCH